MAHSLQSLSLLIWVGALLAAAGFDLTSYIIPNWLCGLVALTGLLAVGLAGPGLVGFGWHVAVGAAVLLAGALLFAAHVWGAGDAKLLAATALWAGSQGIASVIVRTALVGGVLALAILALRKTGMVKARHGVPYGVAIAAGGIITLVIDSHWFPF